VTYSLQNCRSTGLSYGGVTLGLELSL